MKADSFQQLSLLELAELDVELSRLNHRAAHLPEQQRYTEIQAEQGVVNDRLSALTLALEDIDAQVTRLESEIDGVRQREDRDRGLLDSGSVSPKQLEELQHELDTLQRRQTSLEDSLLEVMERREQLAAEQADEAAKLDALQQDLAKTAQLRHAALAEIDDVRGQRSARREELVSGLDAELADLYERQRGTTGVGAARLQGRRCGACRIELDRGEIARIAATPDDEVVRCSECRAILLRVGP
ncbi:MAG TPA: C4-type zinc ribbon domain-containing protein [Mycobacterium sp.]|nr:hypothetical protein [Mycobacterium sp.]MCB9416832.1 hypothetical protein [Mycolicibacterium sp.]HNF06009.1 C4-type zinc ribbon domain-containing protein [Mycobacterium sp.]HNM11532.1 C4-type zinc ribbon domain-containing protein [Mycobacterium sp.]HNM93476.1 C4-type zinc ribbon domain-containing protein [Mycobacterium sp.]